MKKVFFILLLFSHKIFCETADEEDPYTPLKTFAESLHLIEKHYPQKTKRSQLVSGAVKGMLFELDPYSHFMTREEFKAFQKQNKSHYGGLGIEIAFQNQKIFVTSVFENSPAFKKGIQAGDILTHVKGASVERLSFDTAVQKIRGKIGDKISLQVLRKGRKKTFSLMFEHIRVPSVRGMKISDHFFYIRILSFRDSTFKDLKKILKQEFQKQEKGLLIDIRQNAGGLVDQALLSADLFISSGILTSIQSRDPKKNKIFQAKSLGTLSLKFPIVVLMDQFSASASEIFASALQDHKRAVLFGENSFGKGSIQSVFDIESYGVLKLTVAHYYSPKGRAIEKKGLQPDIKQPFKKNHPVFEKFKKKFHPILANSSKTSEWIEMEKDLQLKNAFKVLSVLSEQ